MGLLSDDLIFSIFLFKESKNLCFIWDIIWCNFYKHNSQHLLFKVMIKTFYEQVIRFKSWSKINRRTNKWGSNVQSIVG